MFAHIPTTGNPVALYTKDLWETLYIFVIKFWNIHDTFVLYLSKSTTCGSMRYFTLAAFSPR